MIASGAVPALLPAHIGVSQTSQITTQPGLCRHPGDPRHALSLTPRRSSRTDLGFESSFNRSGRNRNAHLPRCERVGSSGLPVATPVRLL